MLSLASQPQQCATMTGYTSPRQHVTEKMDHACNRLGYATSKKPGESGRGSRARYPYEHPYKDVNRKDASEPPDQHTSAAQNEPRSKNSK
jgi:hypothetical protein